VENYLKGIDSHRERFELVLAQARRYSGRLLRKDAERHLGRHNYSPQFARASWKTPFDPIFNLCDRVCEWQLSALRDQEYNNVRCENVFLAPLGWVFDMSRKALRIT
jgi:hypothetical protein